MMDKMMESFFSNMSAEEKKGMMRDMMQKMMEGMSMGDMMSTMMGEGGGPMDMCKDMMASVTKSSEMASFAIPEVRDLFEEWMTEIDEEIIELMQGKDEITPDEIAKELKISKKSAVYFASRLAQKDIISLKIKKEEGKTNG
jgi:DNA-binding transcriptional MerR regulator